MGMIYPNPERTDLVVTNEKEDPKRTFAIVYAIFMAVLVVLWILRFVYGTNDRAETNLWRGTLWGGILTAVFIADRLRPRAKPPP
jgi:hypothetical protein